MKITLPNPVGAGYYGSLKPFHFCTFELDLTAVHNVRNMVELNSHRTAEGMVI